MRILQLMADGSVGGGPIHLLQIVEGLATEARFGVLTQRGSFLATEAARLGVELFPSDLYPRTPPAAIARVRKVVRVFRPDLVHAHGGRAAFVLAAAGLKADVYTVHGYHFLHRGGSRARLASWAERFTAIRTRRVVFVCGYDASLARRHNLVRGSTPTAVIYNGIRCGEDELAHPRARHVGFVGRFVPQKDPVLLVETLARLPGYQATIVGDGELGDEVVTAIDRHRLADRVQLVGALNNVRARDALRGFGCLVLTSRWEGFPLLMLEAFCAGVPVVAPAVGGIPDAIQHEQTGLLADRDAHAIAAAVARLDAEPELRRRIVEQARERMTTIFSEKRMLEDVSRLYHSLLWPAARP